jgi:hypothetical protein
MSRSYISSVLSGCVASSSTTFSFTSGVLCHYLTLHNFLALFLQQDHEHWFINRTERQGASEVACCRENKIKKAMRRVAAKGALKEM